MIKNKKKKIWKFLKMKYKKKRKLKKNNTIEIKRINQHMLK